MSFRYAFEGWLYVLRTQPNAWIHAAATVAAVALAFWLKVSRTDWTLLVITITLVWAAEFSNTAIEALVDLVSPAAHPLAKTAKDVAAGAVLLTAVAAVIVGLIILGPPLWSKIAGF
ncbi:MAG: diacylglycerol kinase family protein [Candidatus Promineifilaceae bacterium]